METVRELLSLIVIALALLTRTGVDSISLDRDKITVIDSDTSVEIVTTPIPPQLFTTIATMISSISNNVNLDPSPEIPKPDTEEMAKDLTLNYYLRKTGNTISLINKILPVLVNLRDNMTTLVHDTKSVEEYINVDRILEGVLNVVEEHIKREHIQRRVIGKTIETFRRYFHSFEKLLNKNVMREREELGVEQRGNNWLSKMITNHLMRPYRKIPSEFILSWKKGRGGSFPPNAIEVSSASSPRLFICRAPTKNQLAIGKFDAMNRTCSVPYGGDEVFFQDYEILTGSPNAYRWVSSSLGVSVENAFPSGIINDGTLVYVGRCEHGGSLVPGKVVLQGGWAGMYLPSNGKEFYYTDYEILVATNLHEVERAAEELRTIKLPQNNVEKFDVVN